MRTKTSSLKFLLFFLWLPLAAWGQAAHHVVISEVYGGGGNSGSTWKNDFVELYNPTNVPVIITGWSVQYASATGVFGAFKTPLAGTIQPKSFYLIQEAVGTGGTRSLPTPDAVGVIAMSATNGKIALVKDTMTISGPADVTVIDFVGYGSANLFEGSGSAPVLSNTTSAERKASSSSTDLSLSAGGAEEKAGNGWDSNDNALDFVSQTPANPQNSASPREPPPAIQAGIGAAACIPPIMKAGPDIGFSVRIAGTTSGLITGVRIRKHSMFDWSKSNVSVSGPGAGGIVSQDTGTIDVKGLSLAATDSLLISINHVGAPDTTARLNFVVETGAGSDSTAPVTPLPSLTLYGTPKSIASVKINNAQGVPLLLQQPGTVRGIVTVAQHFGGPAYIQDVSGGLAVFDKSFEQSVSIGDEVTVTGTVTQFNGLTELASVTLLSVDSRGNDVLPTVLSISQLVRDGASASEVYEGMLVQINRVTVRDGNRQPLTQWTVTGSGANFWLYDGTDSVQVRIDADVASIVNTPAPTGEFDIIGVVGQFVSSSPYLGGYQLMPRFQTDLLSKGPIITVVPRETRVASTSIDIRWETVKSGLGFLRYGRTKSYELGTISSLSPATRHTLSINGLTAATVYHVQAFSVSGTDTSFATDRVVSTSSLGSSGQINVYFNKSIDPSLARGGVARGSANLTSFLLSRIDAAQKSIDCCVYSMSGGVGQTIANALVRAKSRGVAVRMIVERDNLTAGTGTLFSQIITPAGILWIADDFDAVNGGAGLMHNKFLVIDARGGAPDKVWVWTGSWNLTESGTNEDAQNAIEIQDLALAKAYTLEFDEMWGSDSLLPNAAAARFGARKLDNTPHIFSLNGVPLELYFSPSDRTTNVINSVLNSATHSVNFAMLTFTRSDLASTLRTKKSSGLKVRGVLDNGTDTGSQYSFLSSGGVDVRLKGMTSGLLHHKYAVIDAEMSGARQFVVTGSHNWSSAAENSNNENTLVLESAAISNQYLQEFTARYKEAGGVDVPVVSVEKQGEAVPGEFVVSQNYPNPFNGSTNFELHLPVSGFVKLEIFDVLGRKVATVIDEPKAAGSYHVRWDAGTQPSGVYYCVLTSGAKRTVQAVTLLK